MKPYRLANVKSSFSWAQARDPSPISRKTTVSTARAFTSRQT